MCIGVVFILPKTVIKDIDKKYRNFLWNGTSEVARKGVVA